MALIKVRDAFFFFSFKMCPLEKNSCQTDLNIKRDGLKRGRAIFSTWPMLFMWTGLNTRKGQKEGMVERIGGKGVWGEDRERERKNTRECAMGLP